jgi:hypothetical protein
MDPNPDSLPPDPRESHEEQRGSQPPPPAPVYPSRPLAHAVFFALAAAALMLLGLALAAGGACTALFSMQGGTGPGVIALIAALLIAGLALIGAGIALLVKLTSR